MFVLGMLINEQRRMFLLYLSNDMNDIHVDIDDLQEKHNHIKVRQLRYSSLLYNYFMNGL